MRPNMTQNRVVKAKKSETTTPKQMEDKMTKPQKVTLSSPFLETAENLPEIDIDPEFQELLFPLLETEYALLKESICKNGCTTPLIVDQNGTLVDGHNRYKICAEHGIHYDVRILHFENKEATKQWILEHQLGRRNLTDFLRAETALKLKPMIAAQAKANQKAASGAVPEKSPKAVDTRETVAKMAGTSSNTMSKVEYILEHADEEMKGKLRRGEPNISINKVHKEIKARNTPASSDNETDDPKSDDEQPVTQTRKSNKKDAAVNDDRVQTLLSTVREGYESFSVEEQNRFSEGLHQFLCDIDYLEPEDQNEEPEDEAEDELDDDPNAEGKNYDDAWQDDDKDEESGN